MTDFDPLQFIDAHLDGALAQEDQTLLCEWLRASPDHIKEYIDRANLHYDIHHMLLVEDIGQVRHQVLGDDFTDISRLTESNAPADTTIGDEDTGLIPLKDVQQSSQHHAPPTDHTEDVTAQPADKKHKLLFRVPGIRVYRTRFGDAPSRSPLRILLPAAAVLIAATLAIYLTFTTGPTPQPTLATLAGVNQAVWSTDTHQHLVGSDLIGGRYGLQSGFAKLHMKRGATVLLEGPCEFELLNNNAIRMHRGRVTAQVPEIAHRFTVKTPTAHVVDLGTEFGVDVKDSGYTLAAVFDGRVKLAEASESTPTANSVELTEGKQTHIDTAGRLSTAIQPIATDHAFTRTLHESNNTPVMQGQVKLHRLPLRNIRPRKSQDFENAQLFLESSAVAIDHTLTNVMVEPRTYRGQTLIEATGSVPADTTVDCYMIHFDVETDEGTTYFADATIRFPRPIVAVIARTPQLKETDALFKNPNTYYPTTREGHKARGMADIGTNDQDEIEILPDGHSLRIHLAATGTDQLRVLIAGE